MRSPDAWGKSRQAWVLVGRIGMLDELLGATSDPAMRSLLFARRATEILKLPAAVQDRAEFKGTFERSRGVH
jgi:hypothetical protein